MSESLLQSQATANTDLSVGGLFRFARRHAVLFLALPAAALLLGILFLHLATSRYTVTLMVSPVQNSAMGGLAKLGGLAAIAGVNLPGTQGEGQFALYRAGLVSAEASADVAGNEALMRRLFEAEWSETRNAWVEPQSPIRFVTRPAKSLLGFPASHWQAPGPQRLQQLLEDKLMVVEDKESPVLTLSIEHKDPRLAADLLLQLHKAVDRQQQERVRQMARGNIEHLSRELQATTIAERRVAIASLLLEQENQLMLASSGMAFAAFVFDGPTQSAAPTSPQPLLILAMGLAAGLALALVSALVRDSISTARET
jgi:uncharacterized protein involved in exopolysaccharide biosynthesis